MLTGSSRPSQRIWHELYPQSRRRFYATPSGAGVGASTKALIQQLRQIKAGVRSNVEIVSPNLCDDIIDYIGPSLAKHRHCDIIDVNPGSCIWSTKLHEFLQPRTHLLLEPKQNYFKPFIQPLLKQPGSKYRHSFLDTADWETYKRIFDEGLMQPQSKSTPDQSQLNQPNDSLLLVANFAFSKRMPMFGYESLGLLAIHHFLYHAIRAHSYVHAYGLVRMLMWVNEEDMIRAVPQDISSRTKFALDLEMSGSVGIIASSGKLPGEIGFPDVEIRRTEQVVKTMERSGMKPPQFRQTVEYQQACKALSRVDQSTQEPLFPTIKEDERILRDEHEKELANLGELYGVREVGATTRRRSRSKLAEDRTVPHDQRWRRMNFLRQRKIALKTMLKVSAHLCALDEEIFQLELTLTTAKLSDHGLDKVAKEIQSKAATLKAGRSELVKDHQIHFHWFCDNYYGRGRTPPLLQWDQRTFEPLVATKNEFHPKRELGLLDMQPKAPSIITNIDRSENGVLARYFLSQLFYRNAVSVSSALDSCAPGAADELLPHAPSVTNPAKRGRLDPGELRVRLLTLEMVEELLRAWENWPFRPSLAELRMSGSLRDDQHDSR